MDLTIVGCSGSFPGPASPASSYLVVADGFSLLVDVGNGAFGALQRYTSGEAIDAVLLSHLHSDHCLDMCSYMVFRTFHPAAPLPRIPVYGPEGTQDRLERASGGYSDHPMAAEFDFVTLAPGKTEIGPFVVTADHMNHPVETFGIRLEHGGRAIAYSADTGPTDRLVNLASGADVLICEATFTDGPDLPADLHLTARQAGEHATRAGVSSLVLTHLVPWNDRSGSLADAATGFDGPLALAEAGQVL